MDKREITVKYLIDDDQYERLQKITHKFNELSKESGYQYQKTPEEMFVFIMCLGSKYDIEAKLSFYENMEGKK